MIDAETAEKEIQKAFRTIAMSTSKAGPKAFGNGWPEIQHTLRERWESQQNNGRKKTVIRPSSSDISAAEAIFDVINSLDERARIVVYRYHLYRSIRFSKDDISKKFGLSRRKLGRKFDLYHQELATLFSRNEVLRHRYKVDETPKNSHSYQAKDELRAERKTYWRSEDARGSVEDFVEVAAE